LKKAKPKHGAPTAAFGQIISKEEIFEAMG
jgi:hypothetical protein